MFSCRYRIVIAFALAIGLSFRLLVIYGYHTDNYGDVNLYVSTATILTMALAIQYYSSLLTRKNSFEDTSETANLICNLVGKLAEPCPALPSSLGAPMLSKRKRDAELETVYVRQLMCIPSISERIARKLLTRFSTVPELQRALVAPGDFPRVELDGRTCLGRARLAKLRCYLT